MCIKSNACYNYNEKGFVVIKKLVDDKDILKLTEIAKRRSKKSSSNNVIDYFNDYIRFLDPRLYPKLFKWMDTKYFFDCFYLISRSKKKNWNLIMQSINKEKKNLFQE